MEHLPIILGRRLKWAREQQGLTLQQVSERSGLAIGYISQLENGLRSNPTLDALQRLATAVKVNLAFVLGEVQSPVDSKGPAISYAWECATRFAKRMHRVSPERYRQIEAAALERRFALVVRFLCRQFPDHFTPTSMAYQLGLSVHHLNDVMYRGVAISLPLVRHMTGISGIPIAWFVAGLRDVLHGAGELTQVEMIAYARAIEFAAKQGLTPDDLLRFLEGQVSRRRQRGGDDSSGSGRAR